MLTRNEQNVVDLIFMYGGVDGEHHKQWYLEEIAKLLGIDIPNFAYDEGISP